MSADEPGETTGPGGSAAGPRRPGRPSLHWFDLTADQRVAAMVAAGLPPWRAGQVSRHVFGRRELDPAVFSDLPRDARQLIAEKFFPSLLTPDGQLSADKGRTVKQAWRLGDGAVVESVVMRYPHRDTVCISSQAGCGMGCVFCATGQAGLQRNLSPAEIVAQVAQAEVLLAAGGLPGGPGHVGNVVLMGMGEPMANYANMIAAVRQIVTPLPDGWGISARSVTVSTVGLVPGMRRLAGEGLPLTLALSLHAPSDALRDELVPVNRRYPVAAVLDAAWDYARLTKRRVSIEYALIRGVNDHPAQADELGRQLRQRGDWTWAHVNLIPLNPTPGSPWQASTPPAQASFQAHLERFHLPVTVRDTRGSDIDGACGQLAAATVAATDGDDHYLSNRATI